MPDVNFPIEITVFTLVARNLSTITPVSWDHIWNNFPGSLIKERIFEVETSPHTVFENYGQIISSTKIIINKQVTLYHSSASKEKEMADVPYVPFREVSFREVP